MQIKNKVTIVLLLAVSSWFLPLTSVVTHVLVGIIRFLTNNNISVSWDIITIIDTVFMTAITFIFIMLLRKKFNNKDLQYGIIGFAILNFLCGLAVYKNPISLLATFYQTINFLSHVIISNFVFVLEEGKPFMLLLPITTFLTHILLNYLVTFMAQKPSRNQ